MSHYSDEKRFYREAKHQARLNAISEKGFTIEAQVYKSGHIGFYYLKRHGEVVTYRRKGQDVPYGYSHKGSAINRAEKIIYKERMAYLESHGFTFHDSREGNRQKNVPFFCYLRRYGQIRFSYIVWRHSNIARYFNKFPVTHRKLPDNQSSFYAKCWKHTTTSACMTTAERILEDEKLFVS